MLATAILLLVACGHAAAVVPQFVHLALTGNITEMAVSWFTDSASHSSIVKYGTESGVYLTTVAGTMRSFNESVGFTHDAVMTGLTPDTRYYYVVGSDDFQSAEYYFNTTSAAFRPFTVPMYGDFGVANSEYTVPDLQQIVLDHSVDFIFHVGDISYANDYDSSKFETIWSAWFQETSKFMPFVPYMVCPGNHEFQSGAPVLEYSKDFKPYNYRFRMPWAESNSTAGNNMWFSFDYHNVHFVAVDTESDFPGAPEAESLFGDQLTWLEKDLAATKQPWIIVGGHRPIYSAAVGYIQGGKPFGNTLKLQQAMEDLFHKYKVDLFVVGHQHAYERHYPTYKSAAVQTNYNDPQATVHIIAGSAGCEEGISADWVVPRPAWNAYRYPEVRDPAEHQYGYGLVHVHNDTHLQWDFVASRTFNVIDSIIINKSAPTSR